MTTVSNNVTTVEYTLKPTETAKKTSPASVFSNVNNTTGGTNTASNVNTKLDELVENLKKDFEKYGLTKEQILSIAEKIIGINENQIECVLEKNSEKVYIALKHAISDSIIDGKINIERAAKLGNIYNMALSCGYSSIDDFKKTNKNSNEDISARMERFFNLRKGSFNELSQEKVEDYLERYFNQYFDTKIKAGKKPEDIYRLQLRDFFNVLVNTPDDKKAIFKQALISLVSSNKYKGLDAVLKIFDTQEARTEFANKCDTEWQEKFSMKQDIEGNILSSADCTAAIAALTANMDESHIRSNFDIRNQKAKAFFEQNKDILDIIKEKLNAGQTLSEEEKQIFLQYSYYISSKAGEMSGTSLNSNIAQDTQNNILSEMNEANYNLPIYKEILSQIDEYIESHPEVLTIPKEEFIKTLDEATKGNYSIVTNNSEESLRDPSYNAEKTSATDETGRFILGEFPAKNQQRAVELYNILVENNIEDDKITVENTTEPAITETQTAGKSISPQTLTSISMSEINNMLENGEITIGKAIELLIKKYNEIPIFIRDWVNNQIETMSKGCRDIFLSNATGSTVVKILRNTNIDLADISEKVKKAAGYDARKQIEKMEESVA